ncbi:MAG: WYL domain-containing protein, partial [Bacteroidales bacterium]|nr:WYL domain-containing protein [Bacteroidales bacterium]
FVIHPYSLKVVQRRWYIVAFNPYYEEWNKKHMDDADFKPRKEILVYGLDRILDAEILDTTFKIKKGFSMKKLFEGCTGIIPSDGKIEEVIVKSYGKGPDYLRTLPLHESQQEVESGNGYAIFSYKVKLTYDFMQLIMRQGDQVEVLSPESLRNDMRNLAKTLTSYYKK